MITGIKSIAFAVIAVAASTFCGCAAGEVETSSADQAEFQELLSQVRASEETRTLTRVAVWDFKRHPITDAMLINASDASGQKVAEVQVTRDGDSITVSTSDGMLVTSTQGEVLTNSLSPDMLQLIGRMSKDLGAAQVEYGWFRCAASVLLVVAVSVDCGGGTHLGCLGIPGAFCDYSEFCGNNVC